MRAAARPRPFGLLGRSVSNWQQRALRWMEDLETPCYLLDRDCYTVAFGSRGQ